MLANSGKFANTRARAGESQQDNTKFLMAEFLLVLYSKTDLRNHFLKTDLKQLSQNRFSKPISDFSKPISKPSFQNQFLKTDFRIQFRVNSDLQAGDGSVVILEE